MKRATLSLGPQEPVGHDTAGISDVPSSVLCSFDGIAVKASYVDLLPKSRMVTLFLEKLSIFCCIPSGSSKPFLNSGSLYGAFLL